MTAVKSLAAAGKNAKENTNENTKENINEKQNTNTNTEKENNSNNNIPPWILAEEIGNRGRAATQAVTVSSNNASNDNALKTIQQQSLGRYFVSFN